MEVLIFLKKVPLFSNFELENLLKLKEITEEKSYKADEIIIKEGESGSEAYVIVSGSVEVIKQTGEETKVLATIEQTGYFGEMAIIENEPRSATVRAKNACTLLTIKGEEFRNMMKTNAELSFNIIQAFSKRIREINRRT